MATEEEILLRFKSDFTEITSSINKIEKQVKEISGKPVVSFDGSSKKSIDNLSAGLNNINEKTDSLNNGFSKAGKSISASLMNSTKGVGALQNSLLDTTKGVEELVVSQKEIIEVQSDIGGEIDDTAKKIKTLNQQYREAMLEAQGGSKKAEKRAALLGAEIYNMGGEIEDATEKIKTLNQQYREAMLEAQGGSKEATKRAALLKAEIYNMGGEIEDATEKVKTLKQQYGEAMLEAQGGSQEAAKRAALLKSEIDDTNEKINELASGSNLVKFSNTLGSLSQKIISLDFEGAAQKAKQLAEISSKITFKEAFGGLKALGSSLIDLGKAILVNPLFLIGAAITGVVAAIYSWVTAESVLEKQIRLGNEALDDRVINSEAAYNNELAIAKARGKQTFDLEKKRTNDLINEQKERIRLSKLAIKEDSETIKEYNLLYKRSKQPWIKDMIEEIRQGENYVKVRKAILAAEREIEKQKTNLIVLGIEEDKYNKKKAEDDRIKINEDRKKINEDRKKALEDRKKIEAEERQASQKKYADEIRDAIENAKFLEEQEQIVIKAQKDREEKANKEMLDLRMRYFEDIDNFETAHIEEATPEEIDNAKKQLENDKLNYDERLKLLKKFRDDGLIGFKEYLDGIKKIDEEQRKIISDGLRLTVDSVSSLFDLLAKENSEFAESAKVFALFQIAVDEAKSIASVVAGATQAAAAGGPAAPFLLAGYIASGIATVGAALLKAKNILESEPPQKLSSGTAYVHRGNNPAGVDTIPAMLDEGERVVDRKKNKKYWGILEAIRTDTLDSFVNLKYVVPAISSAVVNKNREESIGLSKNIATALGGGEFSDKNIVFALHRMNNDENKRHNATISAIIRSKSFNRRKA